MEPAWLLRDLMTWREILEPRHFDVSRLCRFDEKLFVSRLFPLRILLLLLYLEDKKLLRVTLQKSC